MVQIPRSEYAALYGPTVGDQIRLGDTALCIEVEQDLTAGGEEAVFGGGKSIRESMAQGSPTGADGAPDTVTTNATVLDHWGSVRADVGIRDGRIVAIGRAGNPDVADGVHPLLEIGPSTDVISGEGKILTAGGIDTHVHLISPSQIVEALATGLTTLGGGGTGPSEGTKATTVTPGAWHLEKIPGAIDAALRGADEWGLQVALHSDSLNEAGYVASTIAAIGGRSISAFHVEGAGGGHSPAIPTLAGLTNVIPGSTHT